MLLSSAIRSFMFSKSSSDIEHSTFKRFKVCKKVLLGNKQQKSPTTTVKSQTRLVTSELISELISKLIVFLFLLSGHFSCSPYLFVAVIHPNPRGSQIFPPFSHCLTSPPIYSPVSTSAPPHIDWSCSFIPLLLCQFVIIVMCVVAMCLIVLFLSSCVVFLHGRQPEPVYLPLLTSALFLSSVFGSSPAFPET